MNTLKIRELGADELELAYPVVKQLRTHLSLEEYVACVKAMLPNGYRAVCLFEGDTVAAYAGFSRQLNLYYGDHVWVYDLVTDKEKRGMGYGKALLGYIEQWVKDNSLNCIALSSGLQRKEAHRFYENGMGYCKTSYVFKKEPGIQP
jgi:GNAT superfamily N-acetyltransferase